MAENNATCSICGKGYYLCLSCKGSLSMNPWKIHTDTSEHYKVYQTIHGLSTGAYTKDEARTKFKNIDLSDLNSFRPHIKKIIKDVLKEEKNVTETVKVEKINEAEVIVAEDNSVVEDIVNNIEEAVIPRKRSYKVEAE